MGSSIEDLKKNLPTVDNEFTSSDKLKGIKKLYRRIFKKDKNWSIFPFKRKQNELNDCQEKINIAQREFSEKQIKINEEYFDKLQLIIHKRDKLEQELEFRTGVLARQLMWTKWRLIDRESEIIEKSDDFLKCKICGHEGRRDSYETMISKCQFNGGKLVRYVCPECGVIFGPTKFSTLNQDNLDEDYIVHYFGYDESVLTNKEVEAFYMLNPEKNGIYLNYGCGCWSKSIQKLREDGYNVYGYEPYSPETENPYMITNKKELCKMKFDGIFSNDLLEHLLNPIEDLKFMKTLLKDPRAKMSHSTACYIYKYEITRFHTHFFTGNSVKVMCDNVGFKILDYRNAIEQRDFICYVFGIEDIEVKYNPILYVSENGERKDDEIILHKDGLICGPYMVLSPGSYNMCVEVSGIPEQEFVEFKVTSNKGQKIIENYKLQNGDNKIVFQVEQNENESEFVIRNEFDVDLIIGKISML